MSSVIVNEVIFSDHDYLMAQEIAHRRHKAAPVTEAAGVRMGTYDPWEIELVGAMAEIGAARYFSVEPDLEIYERRADAGADLLVHGMTVNVKGTIYQANESPHLLVRDYDTRYDRYLLCTVSFWPPKVMVVGWVPTEVIASKEPTFFRDTKVKTRIVKFEELRSVAEWGS